MNIEDIKRYIKDNLSINISVDSEIADSGNGDYRTCQNIKISIHLEDEKISEDSFTTG